MAERRPPIHPGRVLQLEFLEPLGLTPYALAKAIRVPTNRVTRLVNGQSAVSTDTAFRLSRYFGTSPRFWLELQAGWEVRANEALARRIAEEVAPRAAP